MQMTTISDSAGHATEQVKEAASHARARFFDFSTQVLKLVNGIREAQGRGADTVLDRLGLQRQTGPLGPALWFAAGAVTAGAAVLLLAPMSGKKLRQRIASFIGGEVQAAVAEAGTVEQRVEEAVKGDARASAHAPNGAKP
jgi:hypothetical protein